MIKIYDINDKLLMQAEVTSAAKREQEMSKSDYISLSFSAADKVILPVGAYINYTYKIDKVREVTRKFLLLESYEPTQSDECSWKYTPQFQHPKMILSKTPFFIYIRNSQNVEVKQNVWSFVGITSVLSGKIADFLNKDLMFGECGWKVIFQKVTANTINVSFSDNDFISALTAITNAIGDNCEWHIDYDDEIIYIGKVLIGATPVVLEVGKNVGIPSINNSKEGYYNAFSIFGGTRNITQVNSKGENVSSGDIRLQLDEGNGTILIDGKERSYSIDKYSTLDLRADKIKEPLFTKVLDFSQIFPSLNTYVYNVRGRVKYVLDEKNNKIPISNADGSVKGYKTFTVWYMRLAYPTTEKIAGKKIINTTIDDGITHYWYDFEVTDDLRINGKNIGCSFEPNFNTGALSTPLAGQGTNGEYVGFELTYHKEASSSHTSDDVSDSNFSVLAGDYEIIYQEDNEVIIPTNEAEMLIPRGESMPSLKCNITVLYNIAMADTIYYEDAQNRLLEKAKEEIVRLLSDLNNYEVKSYSDVFLEDNPQLQIGQSVTYKDGHGYELATRVLKLSTNIDYDFIQSITIGNQVIKGTITQLKEDVQTIIASGGSSSGGGGYSVSQLRSFIAKYGGENFLSKQFDDIAYGTITFQKVQRLLNGFFIGHSNEFSIDGSGNAILSNVIVNLLKSLDFNESEQSGFAIKQRSDGKFQMLLTDLIVWGKAIFNTLLIRELSYVGGNIVLSPAAGKISYIKEVFSETTNELIGWQCYLLADDGTTATINSFKVEDQVRCQTFNIKPGVYANVSNKDYWRLVTKVSTENEVITDDEGHELYDGKKFAWIQIAKENCMEGSDNPAAGDTIVLMGNRRDTSRQHLLMMETEGDSAPRFTMYRGINSYSLKNKSIFDVSFDGINIVSKYFKMVNVSGEKVWTPIYLGDWKEGTEYSYYDEVTWMGTRWLCISQEGQTTTAEPSEDSPYWKATTAVLKIKLQLYHDLAAGICKGETHTVVCRLMLGDKDVTTAVKSWAATRKTDDAADDIAWALKDKVKNFKGSLDITWANDNSEDDLGRGDVASFTFTAITNTGDVHKATLDL
nr:MAG TPA: tail protein [Caudoviricetes sp.]